MKNLIEMILYRISKNTIYLLMAIFIPPIVVIASIIFTNNIEHQIRIGAINVEQQINIQNVNIIKLNQKPKLSELVQGKYDAVIENEDGKLKVTTIKGEEYENTIKKVLNNEISVNDMYKGTEQRGVIANLVGFLTMLLLLLGSMLYKFYYQEKNGIDKRILASSIGYTKYTLSHPIVIFLILFIPTISITLLVNAFYKFNTNVSVFELSFVLFTICILATNFSYFVASVSRTEENGSLIGTMIIVATSLVSGSFIEISKGGITKTLSYLFPQRYIIDFAINIEKNNTAGYTSMCVIIALSMLALIAGGLINKKRVIK